MIVELLKDLDLIPPLQSVVDVVIFPYGEEQRYDPGLGFQFEGLRFRLECGRLPVRGGAQVRAGFRV